MAGKRGQEIVDKIHVLQGTLEILTRARQLIDMQLKKQAIELEYEILLETSNDIGADQAQKAIAYAKGTLDFGEIYEMAFAIAAKRAGWSGEYAALLHDQLRQPRQAGSGLDALIASPAAAPAVISTAVQSDGEDEAVQDAGMEDQEQMDDSMPRAVRPGRPPQMRLFDILVPKGGESAAEKVVAKARKTARKSRGQRGRNDNDKYYGARAWRKDIYHAAYDDEVRLMAEEEETLRRDAEARKVVPLRSAKPEPAHAPVEPEAQGPSGSPPPPDAEDLPDYLRPGREGEPAVSGAPEEPYLDIWSKQSERPGRPQPGGAAQRHMGMSLTMLKAPDTTKGR